MSFREKLDQIIKVHNEFFDGDNTQSVHDEMTINTIIRLIETDLIGEDIDYLWQAFDSDTGEEKLFNNSKDAPAHWDGSSVEFTANNIKQEMREKLEENEKEN